MPNFKMDKNNNECLEYAEFPGVEEGVDRKLVFTEVKWLRKVKFEKMINDSIANGKDCDIYPCLNQESRVEYRQFIGKTIPKMPPVSENSNNNNNDENNNNMITNHSPHEYLEVIGSVYLPRNSNKWKLIITHDNQVFEIDDDFLVLYINDPNSFFWNSNIEEQSNSEYTFRFNNKNIPRYAFRAAVDKIDCKYSYIGRTLVENEFYLGEPMPSRPKFYMNGWFYFSDNIPQTFGKINRSYKLLFAAHKNMELGFDQFETLCLKASPAPLKILCRSALRKYLNFSQQKIKSINDATHHIPKHLIDYLKFPSSLKAGEFMLKDEKLVKEEDDYELFIDQTGNLVCKSLTTNKEKLIAYNVDTIWLHRFQTVFYNHVNSTAFTAHSIYENLASYKFLIQWEKFLSQVVPM